MKSFDLTKFIKPVRFVNDVALLKLRIRLNLLLFLEVILIVEFLYTRRTEALHLQYSDHEQRVVVDIIRMYSVLLANIELLVTIVPSNTKDTNGKDRDHFPLLFVFEKFQSATE